VVLGFTGGPALSLLGAPSISTSLPSGSTDHQTFADAEHACEAMLEDLAR